MTFQLPRIYPITHKQLSGLSHADQVARLIDGGASLIQLRDKESAPNIFFKEASAALAIARSRKVKLIINDRIDIAMALDADGVHLGQKDIPPDAARKMLKPDSIVGVSTHNITQVQIALTLPVDYIAFGPIFTTRSKSNNDPVVGLDQLAQVKKNVRERPLVAIGGITEERVIDALKAGADAVALISALLSEPRNIEQNMRKLLALSL